MEHRQRQTSAQTSARVNVGGQEVNINVNLNDNKKAVGPIHLSGDEYMPLDIVKTHEEKDKQSNIMGARSDIFANPKQNAYRIGFKEGMQIADFGSGSGAYIPVLSDIVGISGTVYAVDVQRDLLTRIQNEATKEGRENVKIVWSDIEAVGGIGIKDELLDGALLSNTLFQVDNKIVLIKEVWRTLRKGGTLAVIDWEDSFGGLGPTQNSVVTKAEAILLCTDNGFALKNDFQAGKHHYGLIFIKMMEGERDEDVIASTHRKENDFISRTIAQEII